VKRPRPQTVLQVSPIGENDTCLPSLSCHFQIIPEWILTDLDLHLVLRVNPEGMIHVVATDFNPMGINGLYIKELLRNVTQVEGINLKKKIWIYGSRRLGVAVNNLQCNWELRRHSTNP
jgi:hypothetical protein